MPYKIVELKKKEISLIWQFLCRKGKAWKLTRCMKSDNLHEVLSWLFFSCSSLARRWLQYFLDLFLKLAIYKWFFLTVTDRPYIYSELKCWLRHNYLSQTGRAGWLGWGLLPNYIDFIIYVYHSVTRCYFILIRNQDWFFLGSLIFTEDFPPKKPSSNGLRTRKVTLALCKMLPLSLYQWTWFQIGKFSLWIRIYLMQILSWDKEASVLEGTELPSNFTHLLLDFYFGKILYVGTLYVWVPWMEKMVSYKKWMSLYMTILQPNRRKDLHHFLYQGNM